MFKFFFFIAAVAVVSVVFFKSQTKHALAPSPSSTVLPNPTAQTKPTPNTQISSPRPTDPGLNISSGWRLTVYYTPVEKYHGGEEEHVPGIGSFSSDFLEIVRLEGVGKISKGTHAGKYLHQTDALGYWLTDEPLDAQGKPLIPMKSAAAHSAVKFGTKAKIIDCGKVSKNVCSEISRIEWIVNDRFQYQDDEKHLDLYIGEEDREDFLQTHPLIFASNNARVAVY